MGIVTVPDQRLDEITKYIKPQKVIPTAIEFVDIAGLVAGASKGEGLGNQFLGNIRETDAIIHVVRCFENDNVVHVDGSVDAARDIDVINTELLLSDLESLEKRVKKNDKILRANSKDVLLIQETAVMKKALEALENGKPARSVDYNEEETLLLKRLHLITSKPVLYVCNIGEEGEEGNAHFSKVSEIANSENNECISICSSLEAEIIELEGDEKLEFLESIGQTEPGLNRLIRKAYELLSLDTYFTAGEKEVRAWTIPHNAKAPRAAAEIHTDFEKGFIRAEVYHCDVLFELHSEQAIKEAGKFRSEGKEYVVKDGDVMHFLFNV